MRPQAAIFDIGGVLLEWNRERASAAAFGPARARSVFAAVDLHGMNAAMRGAWPTPAG